MSISNNQLWGNGQTGIFALLLIIFLIWVFAGGRPYFRGTGHDIRATVHDAGQDLKATGRDAASSIRDTVQ
jgi:TM2 domain-containing membrane protein YozV